MVFENLTLFEIELDDPHFGPQTMSRDDASFEERSTDGVEHAESGSRGRLLPVFLLAALAVGAVVLYRRSQSVDVDIDADAESEDADADLATAQ